MQLYLFSKHELFRVRFLLMRLSFMKKNLINKTNLYNISTYE